MNYGLVCDIWLVGGSFDCCALGVPIRGAFIDSLLGLFASHSRLFVSVLLLLVRSLFNYTGVGFLLLMLCIVLVLVALV
jgi:hypothetical protein